MKKKLLLGLMLGFAFGLVTANANPITIYDSISAYNPDWTGDTTTVGDVTIGSDTILGFSAANSFSVGANAFTMTQLDLVLYEPTTANSDTLTIGLYGTDGTLPGSDLYTIADESVSSLLASGTNEVTDGSGGTLFDVQLTLGTPQSLSAATRYWIQLSVDNNPCPQSTGQCNNNPTTDIAWAWTYELTGTGVYGEWENAYWGNAQNTPEGGGGPYQMAITGTEVPSVPEPSTILLGGLGLGLLAAFRRRRAA